MRKLALQNPVALIISALLAQLAAAEPARADLPSAQEDITAMNREFEAAFAAGDAASIADQYTRDAQSLIMHMKAISGRAAIKAQWERVLSAMKGVKVAIHILEVQEMGDWAYETDQGVHTFPDGSVIESKWLLIRKFEDGKWRIHRESGSDNAPSGPSTQNKIAEEEAIRKVIRSRRSPSSPETWNFGKEPGCMARALRAPLSATPVTTALTIGQVRARVSARLQGMEACPH